MRKHFVSILRSPIGYILNLIATINQYIPAPKSMENWLCAGCETFCLNDGVQDDPLF